MLIILVELALIFKIMKLLKSKGFSRVYTCMASAFFVQALILLVYRLELGAIGREVYYSDAEVYWNATLGLLQGQHVMTWNMGYVYYSYLIQVTSPFVWVGFINISNILLIDITSLMFAYLMMENDVPLNNVRSFVIMSTVNPLIIYSLARNLKDILFLFYTAVVIMCFHWLQRENNGRILIYSLIVVLTVMLSDVRPWGFLVSVSLFLYFYMINFARNFRRNPILFFVSFVGIVIATMLIAYVMRYLGYLATLELWVPIVLENAATHGILNLLLAPFRILIGPGPVRAIQGSKYFLHYTISGNVFSAIGALLWWLYLGSLVSRLIVARGEMNNTSAMFAIVWVLFLSIYALQYGGSLELRFRGIVYILTSALIMSIVDFRVPRKARILSVVITGIVFVGGLVFG